MDKEKNPILIFGGTGHYGSRIVKYLLAKGIPVRVVSRNAQNARDILGVQPQILEGDVRSKDLVHRALQEVRAVVICVSTLSWKAIKQIRQIERDAVLMVLEEAKRAGISRIVYTSGYEIREDVLRQLNLFKFGEIKLEIEKTLARSALNWTILGCAPSMELFLSFVRNGRMIAPGGGLKPLPTISREDVGEIAAQAILRNDLSGKRFRLTGPEAFSFPEAATRISEIIKEPIKVKRIPLMFFNIASLIILPINPFLRYIFWSLKLLNNFPEDLAGNVPDDHKVLRQTFEYSPTTFDMEIRNRFGLNGKNSVHR